MRVFVDVLKVDPHGLQQVLAYGLRELPPPLRVEVRIWDDIQRWHLRNIGSLHRLCITCAGDETGGKGKHGAQRMRAAAPIACDGGEQRELSHGRGILGRAGSRCWLSETRS